MFDSKSSCPLGSGMTETSTQGLPPVEKQPPEILMNIFILVRILEHEPPTYDPILSSFAVNRHWRSLALSMPILWSTITLAMATNPSHWHNRVLLSELFSERAKMAPLTWIIRNAGLVDEETTRACASLLSKHLPRIQNLVIDSPQLAGEVIIHPSSTQLASLKRLSLNTSPGPLVAELLHAPNLEHVYLTSIFHCGTRFFPCLRTIYANIYARAFYEIILQSPKLEGMTVNVLATRVEDWSDPTIPPLIFNLPLSLPFLTTLSVCWSGCDIAIDLMPDMPALQQVDLNHYPSWAAADSELEAIGKFFRKLPSSVHHLCYSFYLVPSPNHYERTCQMFFESTQALINIRKLVFGGASPNVAITFLPFLNMFFSTSTFSSVTRLAIHGSYCCSPEELDSLYLSDITQSWFSLRPGDESHEILDIDIYPVIVGKAFLVISDLSSKWDVCSSGKVPLRVNFYDNEKLPVRTTNTFPYIFELDPHVDAETPLYCR